MQYWAEIIGVYFFAISGVLATDDKDRNWVGAAFTAFITAMGGGTLRDMLLGSYPLVWVKDINFLYTVLLALLTMAFFMQYVSRFHKILLIVDSVGIGLFTIVGVEKSLSLDVQPEIAVMMGVFTAIMGGVIRDTLLNKTPILFNKEVYATACLSGAILYCVLDAWDINRNANFLISCGLIIVIRSVSIRYNLQLPEIGKGKS